MDGLTELERLEEEERHARMRLEAGRARLANGEARSKAHVRLHKLEREWERTVARLHRARGDGEH